MDRNQPPTVMVLDGDNVNALQVATELSEDLDAEIVGVGTSDWSRLLRSRHCDVGVTTVHASAPGYAERLLAAVREHEPDLLLPVGYHSVAAADAVRDRLTDAVTCWLPPSDSLDVAVDKTATAALAREVGVDTPRDLTPVVADLDDRGRPGAIADVSFPVFVKARHECGKNVTARVDDASSFWSTYDALLAEAADGVIVQEYVEGERTYGCGALFDRGTPRLQFGHEELRSVPRQGGSGTRVRTISDPELQRLSVRLLDRLDWHGPALVEFKRRPDGSYVLMEINPKFWASYALASQSGYRFASTLAARALGLPGPVTTRDRARSAEMVFPLRELYFAATTDGESVLRSVASMCWPPARFDVNLRDLRAWLAPPVEVVGDGAAPVDSTDEADEGTADQVTVSH